MSGWVWFGVYVVVMWIAGVAHVRSGQKGVIYTDRSLYEQDAAAVLFAPLWMPAALLLYGFSGALAFIGRLVSGVPFEDRP